MMRLKIGALALAGFALAGALLTGTPAAAQDTPTADLVLINGRVYTLDWAEPALDGTPAADAPFSEGRWRPDAQAVAARGGEILFVGSNAEALRYAADDTTRIVDAGGATVLPGLVDAHTHVAQMGEFMTQVDLKGVETPAEAIELVAQRAARTPKGRWVLGHGWDEGDWATRGYPDWEELSRRVPDHPVSLDGLHGFATWCNKLAFELAEITRETRDPVGGEILRNERGEMTGMLVNQATDLMQEAIPEPALEERMEQIRAAMAEMARSGFVAVHEAGVSAGMLRAWEALNARDELTLRMYGMISAEDRRAVAGALRRGPWKSESDMLFVRGVKAFYDGSLGARGAKLFEAYADMPGHTGVSGGDYGFDENIVSWLLRDGFQIGIHAIGDAGNSETIDFFAAAARAIPDSKDARHRIEHAQVLRPDDFARFKELNLIASVQPPHAVEDMTWAHFRLGPERLEGAYAWRRLREAGAALVFGSDLSGSDHDFFYGLHAAVTRRNKARQPEGGWMPEQRMTVEEAVRGYTSWGAYASHLEDETGVLAPGRWADITVIDIDPFELARTDQDRLLDGEIVMTIVGGEIVYARD